MGEIVPTPPQIREDSLISIEERDQEIQDRKKKREIILNKWAIEHKRVSEAREKD